MPTGCFVGIDRCHYRLLAYPPFHFIIHLFFHSWDWRTNKVQATGKIVRVGDLHGVLEWIDLTAPTNRISIPYLCSKRFSLIYFFEQVQSCGEEPEHPNIGSPFQLRASSSGQIIFFLSVAAVTKLSLSFPRPKAPSGVVLYHVMQSI
jgi:hypothetical protein